MTSPAMIGIIISTIRDGRFGPTPARWLLEQGATQSDLAFEIVDLRDYALPLYGSPTADGDVAVQRWQQTIARYDGYIFVTAEYNHSISGALKNALDYADEEFHKKPAAFVGYGGVGGARAIEQLRLICVELQLAPLRSAVHIGSEPYRGVTQHGKQLADFPYLVRSATALLNELAWWAHTLRAGRTAEATQV
jgi:NAD(P)H-dependent FMN reductase